MFRVKICGITNQADAIASADAGADAIGLNFYRESPRFVELSRARDIARSLPPAVTKVGVFVNADLDEVRRTCDEVMLDAIQLHGDEPPEFLAQLTSPSVIRAFRPSRDGMEPVRDYLERCQALNCLPCRVLFDGYHAKQFGGTGVMGDWEMIANHRAILGGIELILAGGLSARNVAAAVMRVRPDAVDTASGVESSPGVKDPIRIRVFVAEAIKAFAEL